MLPKVSRLTKKKDFEAVFKKGKGVRGAFLNIKSLKNALGKNRFGFVVSKKVSVKATVRNKVRRRLQSTVGKINNSKDSQDVIITALPGVVGKEFSEIEDEVARLLKK